MLRLALAGLWLLAGGCTRPNPAWCDDTHPCAAPLVCGRAGGLTHLCVEAGSGGCAHADECTDPARPVCAAGACVACTSDEECLTARPLTPRCVGGACVVCREAGDCPEAQPVCEAGACHACAADDECAILCDDESGRCAGVDEVLYVQPGASSGGDCHTAPCPRLGEAIARVTSTRRFIKVAAGTYGESVDIENRRVTIVGPDASIVPALLANQPAVLVQGAADVTLRGLRLAGAIGGGDADGVRCDGTSNVRPRVRLSAARVEDNFDKGLDIVRCDVVVERTVIARNHGGGVLLRESDYDLTNSIIAANGATQTVVGGVVIDGDPPAGADAARFEFVTVADNIADPTVAGGVECQSLVQSLSLDSSIVYGNAGAAAQVSGRCALGWSDVGPTAAPGTGNIDADPLFVDPRNGDYHLTSGSPCRDKANPEATVAVDIDGDPRPAGQADMGADEIQ